MLKAKYIILASIVAIMLVALVPTDVANAQGAKIGFVRDGEIKTQYKAWQRAQEEFDLERKAWDEEALAKQDELEEMITEYDRQKLILSEEKKKEREAMIRTKQESLQAFTRQIFGPGGTAEKKQQELILPLLDNVSKAIEAVAVEEEYDVVFTMESGLGYIRPSLDLTDKVLEALDKLE